MTIVRLAARPLLASMFVAGGLDALRNAESRATAAKPVIDRLLPPLKKAVPQLPDNPVTLVRINAAVQVAAALTLATGRMPRTSSAVLAGSLVPTTFAGHRFWEQEDPQAKAAQRVQFFKNASMLGGLLLAAVDTEGKPGVAWRARRAAADVRREARVLAKSARREAKLARAQLT
jgi:putative oxidoreductase